VCDLHRETLRLKPHQIIKLEHLQWIAKSRTKPSEPSSQKFKVVVDWSMVRVMWKLNGWEQSQVTTKRQQKEKRQRKAFRMEAQLYELKSKLG